MLPLLQYALVSVLAFYLVSRRIALGRRNRQNWDSLVARMPERTLLIANSLSPEMSVQDMRNFLKETGLLLEMADYADRNSSVDPAMLQSFRSDALELRCVALRAILVRTLSR
jgi:hypothetical protein